MGIVNKENALYWATGIDNTGLHKGREEAMGILKGLASQVTSFDVFGGIGVSAAMAFAKAAKSSYDFQKEFNRNMMEVATISKEVSNNISGYSNQILDLTRNIPVHATDAAKALYQIVSAGHDGADGMKVLEVAAKAAVGGVTDTATAADAITTVLNSYKKTAEEAGNVSDMLFTTVKLGKTTFGELGQTISQVSPIAASFGINIEEVLAAVASLTKQGVPTAQAMTQIRAAITGAANELGDAAFEGRSFQEAMQLIYDKAGGSATVMKEMLGTQEAVSAVLSMTGNNALSAASDLEQLRQSTGAAKDAFAIMAKEATNQMTLLSNNIQATLAPMGEAILKQVSDLAKGFNDAFASGELESSIKTLTELILAVSSAIVVYKGSLAAAAVIKQLNVAILRQAVIERTLEKATMAGSIQGHTALSAAQLKEIATKKLLIAHIRTQTAALKANAAAMLTNPYIAAAAAIAGVGYAFYKVATYQTDAEKGQIRLNKAIKEAEKASVGETRELARLKGELSAATKGTEEYNRIKDEIVSKYGKYYNGLDKEIDKVGLLDETYKKLTESIQSSFAARQYESFKESESSKLDETMSKNLGKIQDKLIEKLGDEAGAKYYAKIREAIFNGGVSVDALNRATGLDAETQGALDKISGKASNDRFQNRAIEGYIKQIVTAQELTDELDKKARAKFGIGDAKQAGSSDNGSAGDGSKVSVSSTYKADLDKAKKEWENSKRELTRIENDRNSTTKQFQDARKELEEKEKVYKNLGGDTSTKGSIADKQKEEEERINNEVLALKAKSKQAEIDLMAEGSAKKIAQIELNYKNEIAALEKQEEAWRKAQGGHLTKEQESGLGTSKSLLKESSDKSRESVLRQELQSMQAYLKEYGTIHEKKLAIAEEYNRKIAESTNEWQRKSLEKERGVELGKLSTASIKESIDWVTVFSEFGGVFKEMIRPALEDAKKYLKTDEFKNSGAADQQALIDAINKMEKSLGGAGGLNFKKLGQEIKIYQDALTRLTLAKEIEISAFEKHKKAQENYTKAKKEGTEADIEAARITLEAAEQAKDIAQTNAEEMAKAAQQSQHAVSETATELNASMTNVSEGLSKMASGGISNIVNGFAQATKDLGGSFGKLADSLESVPIIGWIISIIDVFKDGLSLLVGGILDAVFNAISGIIGDILSGDLFVTIGESIATGIGKIFDAITWGGFSSWINAGDSDESYAEDMQRLSQTNKDLEAAIGHLTEKMNEASITESKDIYEAQVNNLKQVEANLKEQMKRSSEASSNGFMGIGGSHSTDYRINKGMSDADWDAISKAAGVSVKSAGDFFNLTSEQMDAVRTNATAIYSKIKDLADDGYQDAAKYMDQYADMYKELDELESQYRDKLTSTSFESVRDKFKDALLQMGDDSEAFAKNFKDMMSNAFLESMMTSEYDKRLKDWYKSFSEKMESDGGLNGKEQDELREEYDKIADDALKEWEAMRDAMGWDDSSTTSQNSTTKGFQTMSQDTGEELNGRFTALQIAAEEIRNEVVAQTGMAADNLRILQELYSMCYVSTSEHSEMMLNVIDILDGIKRDTSNLSFMRQSLERIEENTKNL
ncbi:MAG: phage tail tape measure protein [Phocaeicola sp.]